MPNFNNMKKTNQFVHQSLSQKNIPAVALLAALIGITPVSYAESLPLGNTAGANNIAVGKNSFASGTGSQAVGNNAVATGGNITPEQFQAELENFRDLLNKIEDLRTQIADQEKQGTVNQQLQDTLNNQIAQYETILERVREKLAQKAELTNQKTTKQGELDSETARLNEMESSFGSNAFIPGGTKENYRNFLNIINALDWDKLNTSTGIADLTADLKNGIEKDFGNLNISDDKYRELIEGYRNAQGNITYLEPVFKEKVNNEFSYDPYDYYVPYTYDDGIGNSYNEALTKSLKYADTYSDLNLLKMIVQRGTFGSTQYSASYEKLTGYPVPAPTKDGSEESIRKYEQWEQDRLAYYSSPEYAQIALSYKVAKESSMNLLMEQLKDTSSKLYKQHQKYTALGEYVNQYNLPLHFLQAPAITASLDDDNYISSYGIMSAMASFTSDVSKAPSINSITTLENAISKFENFVQLIDYNNTTDTWLFDKEEYRTYMDTNVLPFMNKVKELATTARALEDTSLPELTRNELAAKMISLRQELATTYRDINNYMEGFVPSDWVPEIKEQIVKSKDLWIKYQNEAVSTLLPYNPNSVVVQEITKAINAKAAEINTQKEAIKTKETEIADLENQINALALTGEEQSAESIKNDLTVKLDEAKAKLAEITQVLTEKRNELLGLNNQLDTSPLGSKGKNAIAEGNNAFTSGENAIATGADSLATGNNAIALGANAKATADSAIAIGKGAQALKEKALALGENAIANGVSAIAIGDNTGVSGEKAVGIGSNSIVSGDGAVSIGADNIVVHKNAVAVGSNITQTAENSVNLGNESAATVERTAETAGTTEYEHSDLLGEVYKFAASKPTGVVTVGAKGKERRVQNVAAGLVSETSTDAVNGSQLYAVAKAVDEGKIGLVKYNQESGVVSVAKDLAGNEVNLSNKSGETRRLTGVSEGVAPTDAVNKAQLDREIGVVNNRISNVEKEVKNVKGSVSNAVAMASLPQASLPGQHKLSVATGHTLGTTSVAVGLNGVSDNGRMSYKLNTSVSQNSSFAVGAGVGFSF